LQQVAARAGVSAMTASLALREPDGAKRMSPKTRERVVAAARELNYFPNARARALRLGRTNVIGLYAGHGFVNVRSPFFTEIVSGLQEGCEETRKDLLLHSTFHSRSSSDVLQELLDGRIDGLVVSMPPADPLSKLLPGCGFPVVAVADPLDGLPSVVVDDASAGRLIAEHLKSKGHRKALFVMSSTQPSSAVRRRDAFLESARGVGLCSAVWNLREGGAKDLVGHARAAGITSLACWNDDAANDLLAECREMNIAVPEELAITGFDGCSTAGNLTTVVAPWAEAARLAVHTLNSLLANESVQPEQVLPVHLHEGSTT